MTHVKWLRSITVVAEPFLGWQQDVAYWVRESEDDQGDAGHADAAAVAPRAARDPGLPHRTRLLAAGPCALEGRAWSGGGRSSGSR